MNITDLFTVAFQHHLYYKMMVKKNLLQQGRFSLSSQFLINQTLDHMKFKRNLTRASCQIKRMCMKSSVSLCIPIMNFNGIQMCSSFTAF